MSSNPFRKTQSNINKTFCGDDKQKSWQKQNNFKNRARKAAPMPKEEPPTPWTKMKDDLLNKQREEEHANAVNMDSEEAREFLKKREKNYRKNLIEQKRQEPTEWEDFEDEEQAKGHEGKRKTKKKKYAEVEEPVAINGEVKAFEVAEEATRNKPLKKCKKKKNPKEDPQEIEKKQSEKLSVKDTAEEEAVLIQKTKKKERRDENNEQPLPIEVAEERLFKRPNEDPEKIGAKQSEEAAKKGTNEEESVAVQKIKKKKRKNEKDEQTSAIEVAEERQFKRSKEDHENIEKKQSEESLEEEVVEGEPVLVQKTKKKKRKDKKTEQPSVVQVAGERPYTKSKEDPEEMEKKQSEKPSQKEIADEEAVLVQKTKKKERRDGKNGQSLAEVLEDKLKSKCQKEEMEQNETFKKSANSSSAKATAPPKIPKLHHIFNSKESLENLNTNSLDFQHKNKIRRFVTRQFLVQSNRQRGTVTNKTLKQAIADLKLNGVKRQKHAPLK